VWLILETVFQTIRIYGTQQDVVQRYLTTSSDTAAKRSLWIGIAAYIPLAFIFYFIGTALFAFYQVHPELALPGKADPIYPHFVTTQLPPGIAGLVLAAIFAAAMSSIDSAMNSASTVCLDDFLRRFRRPGKPHDERTDLRWARGLTFGWGIAAIAMAFLFMEVEYAQIAWGKLMGIATNGVLGLMLLALLPERIRPWAAVGGFVVSYAALFTMMSSGVNFLLWPVIGNSLCFLTGWLLNRLWIQACGEAAATLQLPTI